MEALLIFIIILLIAILICVYGNAPVESISLSYDTELEQKLRSIELLLEEVNTTLSRILDELHTQRRKQEYNPYREDWTT